MSNTAHDDVVYSPGFLAEGMINTGLTKVSDSALFFSTDSIQRITESNRSAASIDNQLLSEAFFTVAGSAH
ncbi:MAG: hypothetical protein AAGI66_06905 [Cyanobacteria bacterium P01_H01_bin.74]